jgi:hypothetical protein
MAKLKNTLVVGRQQPFHTEFGGCVKEPAVNRECIDM